MREQDKLCTLPIIVLAVLLFVSAGIMFLLSEQALLDGIAIVAAPISAVAVGIFGMYFFIPRGVLREDRFHAMYVLISISLVVLALAEGAGAIIEYLAITDVFLILVGLALITAIFPVLVGVLRYLLGINQTLGYPSAKLVWLVSIILPMILIPLSCFLGYISLMSNQIANWMIGTVLSICAGIILFSLIQINFFFQKGQMRYPMIALLLGFLLFFVRCILWCTFGISPIDTISRYLGIASYLMQGISISLAVSLESY